MFQFFKPHGDLEVTAMCFDHSGRRLITGSRDGWIKLWNFNNGQILRHLKKESSLETTEVMFLSIASHKYIAAVGWDRKITLFYDDPEEDESLPIKTLNAGGSIPNRSHTDDILSIDLCPPNILATASVDGSIIIWNIESGYFKSQLKEPFLDLRNKEEKPIEKVIRKLMDSSYLFIIQRE